MSSNETGIDELATWVTAYREASVNAKRWSETAEKAKEHITAALSDADAEIGTVDGEPAVRWTRVESSRFDTKKFRAEYPDLAEAFTVPSTTRRFTVVGGI